MVELKPLVQGLPWPVLQTAQPTERLLFGRHMPPTGRRMSGLSPRGDGDAYGIDPQAHRQAGRLGAARRSARLRHHGLED